MSDKTRYSYEVAFRWLLVGLSLAACGGVSNDIASSDVAPFTTDIPYVSGGPSPLRSCAKAAG